MRLPPQINRAILAVGATFITVLASAQTAPITVSPASIPVATAGTLYSQTFTASGGVGAPYAWSAVVADGCPQPGWLTIGPFSGTLSGTPPAGSTCSITVTAKDMNGDVGQETVSLPINFSGTVITSNLPAGMAIVNISAASNAAVGANTAHSANNGATWDNPFNTLGQLLEYTVQPGTYTFRVIDPNDAGTILGQAVGAAVEGTAWSPNTGGNNYVTTYLAFDSSAATNPDVTQLFSGADNGTGEALAASAYADAVNGYPASNVPPFFNEIRNNGVPGTTYTFSAETTLIFAVPGYPPSGDAGGVSVLIAPSKSTPAITTAPTLPPGQVNAAYSQTLTPNGGSGIYFWAAAGLPPGLSLSAAGVLSGTPIHTGSYSAIQVTVTDPVSGLSSTTSTTPFSLTIAPPSPALTISTTSILPGEMGAAYSQTIAATGGYGALTWSISSGTPPLSINSVGVLHSTGPLTSGNNSQFAVTVMDGAGDSFTRQYTLLVDGAVAIATSSLPNAAVGESWATQLTASGGTATNMWSVPANSLPAGLTLGSATGVISGTPATAGTSSFSVTVTDSAGGTNTVPLSIVVTLPVGYLVENSTSGGLALAPGNGSAPMAQAAVNGIDSALDDGGNAVAATGAALQRITPVGETISTIATAPTGSSWVAVAADSFGNLIVGDNKAHEIWRVSPDGASTAIVATYSAVNPAQQEDIRILVDVHGNYVVAEDNGNAVSIFSVAPTGVKSPLTLTGATLPQSVGGMTFDQNGNYMLLDTSQQALFRITPQGVTTLFVGTGVLGAGTSGLARNPLTNQYVVGFPGQLKEIPAVGSSVTTLVSNAQLATPAAVVTLTQDFPSTVDSTNPLAYFRLETASGTSDVSAYTYSLTGNAPVAISSQGAPIGNSSNNFASLDGSSGEVTTNLTGNIATAGSIMAWVNLAALPANQAIYYVAGESGIGNTFDLQFEADKALHFYTTTNAASLSYTPAPGGIAGQWHMIAATFDATAGTRAIYWDGALAASDTVTSLTGKTGTFWIGNTSLNQNASFGNRYFNGGIDEVALWNYALTAPQVYRIFASRQSGTNGTINSLSPAGAMVNGSATTLTIAGQNLLTGSTVWWTSPPGQNSGGQTTILTPTSVTANQIVVNIPPALLAGAGPAEVSIVNPAGVPANQLPFTIAYQPLSISPSTAILAGGQTNLPYLLTLTASGGSGNYTWSIANESGGLNLGPASASGAVFVLGGTPTVANTTPGLSLVVTLTDTTTGLHQQQTYIVPIISPLSPLSIGASTGSIATAMGGSVSASFTASGGTAPYTFSISGQPSGVGVGSDGSLSGSPSQAGAFNALVTVIDATNNSISTSVAINVLGLTTTTLPGGTAGQFYSGTVGTTGGTGALSFSATGAPSGLSMSTSGSLTGTTKTSGTFTLNVTVSSGAVSFTGSVTLTIAKPTPLSISSASLVSGTVNVSYSQSLSGAGGIPPYTWTVNTGSLPQGLSMSAAGIVSGTPATVGTVSFGVQVTDAAGAAATATVSILIHAPPLVVTTQTLPSGMNGVDYPQQTLTATGGVSPYTWAVNTGSALPSGMTLSSTGVLSGIPGAAGTFSLGITVTDSDSPATKTSVTVGLTIRPASPDLILTTGSLAFSLSTPAVNPPASQAVGVQATVAAQQIGYSVSVSPTATWLTLSNGTMTPDTIQVSITQAALALSPGDYQTTITAACSSSACNGHSQTVSVDLKVTATPPVLQVDTSLLAFATTSPATGPLSQPIVIENTGGGQIAFTSVACETAWCTANAPSGNLGGGASISIPVTVDPTLLSPGFYRTQVDIATSAGNGSVPVTLFIAANSSMTLAPAGQQFNMPAGSTPGNPNGSFLVSVNNSTPVNWSAAVLPGANWLVLNTAGGTSSSTQPGTVSFSIDPVAAAALSPGAVYGRIEITSTDVSNSPQDFEVVLNVTPAAAAVPPDLEPGGLLFILTAGGVLPPETVTVYSGSVTPLTFQTSATTNSGGTWLSVTPASGTASAGAPGITTVSVDTTGMSPGVYTGGVSYSLSATAIRTVSITLIIPAGTGSAPAAVVSASAESSSHAASANASPRAAGCVPAVLVPAQTGLVNSFSAPAGWPTPLAILLSNDCGSAVNNGQIVATFSNGDPPLALPLADPTRGLYSGTWSPAKTSSQVTIVVSASAPGYPQASSRIAGAVIPNAVPVLTPHGTLHSFDPLVGAALAPGTIVQIYGQNLASLAVQPTAIPLPTLFNGTSVIVGGMLAPLYYVSPDQINAQIPFELQSGQQYQVIISANGALTTPDTIQLSPATPGFAAFPNGTLIAQHAADGSLVSQTSPAQPGEYLVAYLAGMGDTTVPVPSGTASPETPLALPEDAPVLTINGTQSPLAFAGLTPGLVGLYQIDFQVPVGLPAGNITIAISQDGQSSNQTVLPYQP